MANHHRKVELNISDEFLSATHDTPPDVYNAAIGRLSAWAIHNPRYAHLVILGSKEGNLYASYRAAEGGDVTYSMFMELREDGKSYSGPHS